MSEMNQLRCSESHIRRASEPRGNLLSTNDMASAEGSRSNIDEEKTDVISTGEKSGSSTDLVLLKYYEDCAGRVVLDPKYVSFFLLSP